MAFNASEMPQVPIQNAMEQITETFRTHLDLNKHTPGSADQLNGGLQAESNRSRTLGGPVQTALSRKGRRKKPVNRPVAQQGEIPTRIQRNTQNPKFLRSSMNKLTELLEAKLDLSDFPTDNAGQGGRTWEPRTTRSGALYKRTQSNPSNHPTQPNQFSRSKKPNQPRKPSKYLSDQEFIARFGYRPSPKIIKQMMRLEKLKTAEGLASFAALSMNNMVTMPGQELNKHEKAERQALFLLERWERNPEDPLQGFNRGVPGNGADGWFKRKHAAMAELAEKAGEISDDGTIEGDGMEE